MLRRLLFVLVGLGAAAVAAVLWSGSAYASTPHALVAPPVQIPARPGAPTLPLPTPPAPRVPHAPKPTLPPAPVAVPPAVQQALGIVAPVVDRTVRTVQTVAPVTLPLVSNPAPVRALTPAHAARPAPHAHRAASRSTRSFATGSSTHASVVARAASSTPARVKTPAAPRRHAPLGDLSDGTNHGPQTANGTPFAVTRGLHHPAGTRGSRPACETLRDPGAVPLRDIARPG